ncbi:hypothetical protein [uncultured Cohaesibacter sp.]|nr:hypothetical protein [uncultured Cohaesibacter sp.]
MTKKAIDALMSILAKPQSIWFVFILTAHSVNLGLTANEITVRA